MGASDRLTVAAARPRHAAPRAATVLGEPLPASDDDHGLVHPSADFSAQALVSSPQQVQGISFFLYFPFRFR
jgi:acetyl-CoA synthetase